MKDVVADFESYFDDEVSVRTQGVPNYVRDSYAYLLSLKTDDGEWVGHPNDVPEEWVNMGRDRQVQFQAANSNFDQKWWESLYGETLRPWKCVLDKGGASQMPRNLAGIASTLLNVPVDKSLRDGMKGKHWHHLTPGEQQEMTDYCMDDSRTEWDVLKALPEMSSVEEQAAEHTRMINRRGVRVDTDLVDRDSRNLEQLKFSAMLEIPWFETDGTPLSYDCFADYCKMFGVRPPASLAKTDADCDDWVKANPGPAKALHSMRIFRSANTKMEKLKSLQERLVGNIMPLEILYCGARHTRRWSSRGFNVQNLDKEEAFTDELAALDPPQPGYFPRQYLIPPDGHVWGIIDFSQIEPRVLNWVVDNIEMLEAMRAGYGIYEAHARATMGWKGDKGTLKLTDPKLYAFAKMRVIGLGYGMGWQRFQEACAEAGIYLSSEQAKAQVADFRRTNTLITDLWSKFDTQIAASAINHEHISVEMPSGDWLHQFYPRASGKGQYQSFTIKGETSNQSRQDRLWGGTLTENITQRIARDIMAEAILRLEAAGFPVYFHAHDEVIVALSRQGAAKALKEAERIMKQNPEWCPDLPIAVEGDLAEHYTKL